jgi:hypothetical protein
LTRKLTECLDGVDLSKYRVGDILDLSERDARLLLAEGCAEIVSDLKEKPKRRKKKTRPD